MSQAAFHLEPSPIRLADDTSPRRAPRLTAETLATKQREISVSEFFAKNRHLLGFDNPRKALLTTVKEAVDNSLDACEEAGILPDLLIEITPAEPSKSSREGAAALGGSRAKRAKNEKGEKAQGGAADERYRVIVQDNGPGIVRKQIENIFGKLLYGSKFHRLKMSRGQQGIGISAAGMYGLITTGKPVLIISKTHPKKPAHEVVLKMDTSKNKADVVKESEHPEDDVYFSGSSGGTGTRVEIELLGRYFTGSRSVDEYVELTAIANPHARITYKTPPTSAYPEGRTLVFDRAVAELPPQPEEIQPHPHGIELGTLIGMLERTEHTTLSSFFTEEFCRISPAVARSICEHVDLTPRTSVKRIGHAQAERLFAALQGAKVMAPPTNCLSPIGVKTILKGLERGLKPEFIAACSRPPAVYRGRPFIIEAGIAFGGDLPGRAPEGGGEEPAQVFRFANRVPLLYQQSACASFKAVAETSWRNYGLSQPKGSLPLGPLVFMIHMASVWVPFTSESKEAVADYDEIRREMELALQDCGRKLKAYINRRQRMRAAGERRNIFLRYIGEIAGAVGAITERDARPLYEALMKTAQRKTEEMDQVLDDEGRVIEDVVRLDGDDAVYVKPVDELDVADRGEREQPPPPLGEGGRVPIPSGRGRERDTTIPRTRSASKRSRTSTGTAPPARDALAAPTLFAEPESPVAPPPAASPSKRRILVRKKVPRKK